MTQIYSLQSNRLAILNDATFADLVNDLIRAEADQFGISQSDINTTRSTTVSDGGVDASVRANPTDRTQWIPVGRSTWQYKSGVCPSANKLDGKEFSKPGVESAIKRADSYIFVTAGDITDKQISKISAKVEARYALYGLPPKARIYNASHIARWVTDYPAILAKYFDVRFYDGWPMEDWEQSLYSTNTFRADAQRRDLIDKILNAGSVSERCIRIVGPAGIGKTRVVLEALRRNGVRQRVLYWPDASKLAHGSLISVRKSIPNGSAIFVIDECSSEEYARLKASIDALPASFTVICIGPNDDSARYGVIAIGALEIEELSAILGEFVSWPEHQRRAFAKRCEGSPKLIVLLGQELAKRRISLSWAELERLDSVLIVVRRLFPQINESHRPEAKVMRGIAMFSRLGWMEDVASEFSSVMRFFGLSEQDARLAVIQLMKQGIVSRRGRYLYPTPDILANLLTRETLTLFEVGKMQRLLSELGSGATEAFAQRLRQLGEDREMREVVERLVGGADLFRDLTALEDSRAVELIHLLLPAFPSQLVSRIESIIGAASRDRLRQFRQGRREIIWSMQELAWYPEHFQSVVSILRDLAVAENETWGNNATGVLTSLFQVVLSGTSMPFGQRFPHLKRMMEDADRDIRLLGVACLGSALKAQFLTGPVEPVSDLARPVPAQWRPGTYSDWREAIKPLIPLLDHALADGEPTVAQKARDVLWSSGAGLMKLGLIAEWADMAEKQVDCPFEQRRPGIVAVADQLLRNKELSAKDRARLESVRQALVGRSFGDRLKQVVSAWGAVDYGGDEARFQADIEKLAIEAHKHLDGLLAVVPWLYSGAANSGFALGKALGRLDETFILYRNLLSLWNASSVDERPLAGYLAGQCEIRGETWLENEIERWPDEARDSELAARMIWHCLRSPRAARELERRIRSRLVGGGILGSLVYGFWARDMEPAVVQSLVLTSTYDVSPAAQSGRLGFLAQYLLQYPDRCPELTREIWRVLEECSGKKWTAMDDYNWVELARLVVDSEPVRVAALVVQILLRSENHVHDSEDLLISALRSGGWPAFIQVIAPAILEGPIAVLKLEGLFDDRFVLDMFDPKSLVKWIEQDEISRLPAVARAASMNEGIPGPLARALLIRFGKDRVGSALSATAHTGSWSGPHTARIEQRRKTLRPLLTDPEPNVRLWAMQLDQGYESEYKWAKQREEEEGL